MSSFVVTNSQRKNRKFKLYRKTKLQNFKAKRRLENILQRYGTSFIDRNSNIRSSHAVVVKGEVTVFDFETEGRVHRFDVRFEPFDNSI